jgi:hypothetical protein
VPDAGDGERPAAAPLPEGVVDEALAALEWGLAPRSRGEVCAGEGVCVLACVRARARLCVHLCVCV